MARQIFVNLPVRDLERARAFWQQLGFSFDPQFSDDKAACPVIEPDRIYAMLLTEPFFKGFIPSHEIVDAKRAKEVLIALSCSSDQEVKELVASASKAGGRPAREAKDHASCTSTRSRIRTATSGSWCT